MSERPAESAEDSQTPVPATVRAAHHAPRTAWDSEGAAEAGRRSGAARKRKSEMTPEERALDAIGDKLGKLTEELIDAALGTGDFEELKLETRVTALQRLIEWKLGRPAAVKPKENPDENPSVPTDGEGLFE